MYDDIIVNARIYPNNWLPESPKKIFGNPLNPKLKNKKIINGITRYSIKIFNSKSLSTTRCIKKIVKLR